MSPASRLLRYSTTVPSTRPRYYSTASLPHHHYVNIYPAHTASLQGAVEIDQRYSTTPLLYYFTTPLLYYFTTPLLYCFTTSPPLYKHILYSHCVTRSPGCSRDRPALLYYSTTSLLHYSTASLPHHHYVHIYCTHTASLPHHHHVYIHCAHTVLTLHHSLSRVDQRYSTTSLLHYFTTTYTCTELTLRHTASLALQGAVEIDQRYSTTPLLYCFTTSPPPCIHILYSHCVTRSPGCSRDRPALLYYFTTLLLHYFTTTI